MTHGGGLRVVMTLYIGLWVLAFLAAVALFVSTVRARIFGLESPSTALRIAAPDGTLRYWSAGYPVAVGGIGWVLGGSVVSRGQVEPTDFFIPALFLGAVLVLGAAVIAYIRSSASSQAHRTRAST